MNKKRIYIDYCIENNISYGRAKDFISEAHLHIKDEVSIG